MRSRSLPTDESSFYQRLREDTVGSIFWERLELKTDSGYPDTSFVLRNSALPSEGTVELKFHKKPEVPDIRKHLRGTQMTNFLDYYAAGGKRRFLLVCNSSGRVFLYNTKSVVDILRKKRSDPFSVADLDDNTFPVRQWLPVMLEM